MNDNNQFDDDAMAESQSLKKELFYLREETNGLIKDIEVFQTDQEKLATENNQLEVKISQKAECLKKKYNERKNTEQMRSRIYLEEVIRNVKTNYESKVKDLSNKNLDLEESLELMRHEFEKMENYWQKKIEDERSFYDQQIKLGFDWTNFRLPQCPVLLRLEDHLRRVNHTQSQLSHQLFSSL